MVFCVHRRGGFYCYRLQSIVFLKTKTKLVGSEHKTPLRDNIVDVDTKLLLATEMVDVATPKILVTKMV